MEVGIIAQNSLTSVLSYNYSFNENPVLPVNNPEIPSNQTLSILHCFFAATDELYYEELPARVTNQTGIA